MNAGFNLYSITCRDNHSQEHAALVWAHSMSGALAAVEDYISDSGRTLQRVDAIDELRPPTDPDQAASIAWTGGEQPQWP